MHKTGDVYDDVRGPLDEEPSLMLNVTLGWLTAEGTPLPMWEYYVRGMAL
jgi:hypothetical protein